ncbi:MAG: response regulator [Deltaproteobacteria bacterium]|nr:response regulator [Deltaproteobacteria bacterium]
MGDFEILKGKRILAVDDEPDILEIVQEQLFDGDIVTATTYENASKLIERENFDLVILDIMGVNGFQLLEQCSARRLSAAMLTARATDIRSLNRSLQLGAVSFLPKEELGSLRELTAEILEGLDQGQSHWKKLFKRLGPLFKERFGIVWEDLEKPVKPRIPWD